MRCAGSGRSTASDLRRKLLRRLCDFVLATRRSTARPRSAAAETTTGRAIAIASRILFWIAARHAQRRDDGRGVLQVGTHVGHRAGHHDAGMRPPARDTAGAGFMPTM